MGALAISALVISSLSGLTTAIIWHFLRRHQFFCDKTEEAIRREGATKTESICRNVDLIKGNTGVIGKNLIEKMEGIITEVLDLHGVQGNMDRKLDRVNIGLKNIHQDLGILGMIIVRKARYVDYSPGHLPPLLRRENH